MWFRIFMFSFNLLIPILMIVIGRLFLTHPPKTINDIYGYRSSMSKKNQDTWNFAHQFCGKLWSKIGWIMLPISIVVQYPFIYSNNDRTAVVSMILCIIQCLVMIGAIFPVEKALKNNFDINGNHK